MNRRGFFRLGSALAICTIVPAAEIKRRTGEKELAVAFERSEYTFTANQLSAAEKLARTTKLTQPASLSGNRYWRRYHDIF